MYILIKKAETGDGYDVHGVTEDDVVHAAWQAAGQGAIDLTLEDYPSRQPWAASFIDDEEEEAADESI